MPRKKQIVIKTVASKAASSKNDEWRGRLDERTKYIITTVDEIKANVLKFDEKVEKKFEDLDTCINQKFIDHREKIEKKFQDLNECIDQKFKNHNDFHLNKDKKYAKIFICLFALITGCLLSNPVGIIQLASKVVLVLKFLVGLL